MRTLEIIGENLSRLLSEDARTSALTLYELSELARTAADGAEGLLDPAERESHFSQTLFRFLQRKQIFCEGTPGSYLPYLEAADSARFSVCVAAFSAFLCEHLKDSEAVLPFRIQHVAAPRVCYVKQARTDALYLALCAHVPGMTVSYAERGEDAVRAVASGKADYALLPYALNGERLNATLALVAQNDLYLSGTVDVGKGEETLTYALLSRCCAPLWASGEMRFDLRLTADAFSTLGTVFSTISVFGFRQTEFLSEKEEYGRACGRLTLEGDGDLSALWLYLSFLSVGASFLGRYSHIAIEI